MAETSGSFWRDRPTLVTGASGLVGSWVVRRLLEAGAEVVCVMRDHTPRSELIRARLIDRVTVVQGDVCDRDLMERALGEYEIDTVIHLAAQTIVGIANRNPMSTLQSNVTGTWTTLEACRHSPMVKQIVVASSDKAYGEQNRLPYDESMPLMGRHPYDVSKSCADLIAAAYAKTYGMHVAITRCGNFFGGGDLNFNRLVPGTIRSVLRGQRPVVRSDGNYIRDYFYVEDGAAAYLLLAEQLALRPADLRGAAFNFCNEQPLSVIEMVGKILAVMRSNLEPEILNTAGNEIRNQCMSAARARRMLTWSPLFQLDEALARTVAWYKDFFAVSHG